MQYGRQYRVRDSKGVQVVSGKRDGNPRGSQRLSTDRERRSGVAADSRAGLVHGGQVRIAIEDEEFSEENFASIKIIAELMERKKTA